MGVRGVWRSAGSSAGLGGEVDGGSLRADKEADQDARLKALLVVGSAVALVILALHALFTLVGLQLGWWSAPVFVPVFAWALLSAAMNRVLRPVELDGLRCPRG